jgi:3-oxoacyl-[acyl-carrier-protein] synthase II
VTGPREVVVTGRGLVNACGTGVEPLAAALAAGTPCAGPIERLPGAAPGRRTSRTAGRVTDTAWDEWLSRRDARRLSPPSAFAVVAARMALADAGLPLPEATDPACAVLLATSFGASSFSQRMLDQILDEGPDAISPFLFMESVANAPAGQVAILCRAGGPNHTLCQREAGPLAALGRAAAEVSLGRAERALAGAAEEVNPLLHTALDRFGALSDRPRPFDRRRDGLLAAEGATVLVLEPAAAARRRGARVLARVRAWGGTFDASAPAADWGRGGVAVARTMRRGLARAGLLDGEGRPAAVDAVVSGASGARRGDRLEAAVLRELFAGAPPPLLAPKAVTGEYGGAPLVAALLALAGQRFAAPAGGFEMDPELGVAVHDGSPLPAPRRLLLTAQAAGGAGSWLVLDAALPRE